MTVRIATPPEKNPFADKLRREHFEMQQVMDQVRLQNQVLFQLHEQQISPSPTHSSVSPLVPKPDSPAAKKEDKKVQRNGFDRSKTWYEKKNNRKIFKKSPGTPKKFASS
ncbi:Oidioi.mRNA.OKI2018_I69.PAR.g9399.t1.cds [Oikopleura dioica]|uniref:Oidioi.mRNA.OKI2018_I69.PAR.g9399.t1.cds n=1 Tax=Oikopleura dioica TaxID=34765 RepID=A0ABN7RNX8_OIKDI|nr:Oidioi.mRNA.OKI2018_I69.PAR.g9399.t1.cds [Oikopleura dioica]